MPAQFSENFTKLTTLIQHGEYDKLNNHSLVVPKQFNWMRDVF